MIPIEVKFIPEHRANRRAYTKGSAYYQKFRVMDYITVHDVGSDGYERGYNPDWFHWYIAEHPSTELSGSRKAWHYTVGMVKIIQHLRHDEVGLHAGDGLFGGVLNGNSNSIGIEMVRSSTPEIQRQIENNCAWLCALLIHNGMVNKPYPEAIVQHNKWTGKNCPAVLRSRPNGWTDFIKLIGQHLQDMKQDQQKPAPEPTALPVIQREIGIEVEGNKVDEVGYLIGNRTYVRAAWLLGLTGEIQVTGHGDHIKINRRNM